MDVLRLSCIVRSNLEAEAEGAEYNAASTTGAPLNDVQINHQDAELDFDARASDQGAALVTAHDSVLVFCAQNASSTSFAPLHADGWRSTSGLEQATVTRTM